MKKNKTPFSVTITALSHEGRGIAKPNQKTLFVDNALLDETVLVELMHQHSRFNEGIAKQIENPSKDRVTPPCSHYLICGGCRLQHMASSAQIEFKLTQLKEHLTHFGECQPQGWLPSLQAETLGYRRKARLGVKWVKAKNKICVGFRELSGRYIADLTECPVLHPRLSGLIQPLSSFIGELSNKDKIPQIECAMGDEDVALIIRHLSEFTEEDLQKLKSFSQVHHIALFLQSAGPQSVHKIWPENNLAPWLYYELPAHHIKFAFYPTDFTQVNTSINRLMIDQALALLSLNSKDQVLDLFCGIGNFSLPMARYACTVIGVEGDKTMTQRAKENAERNQLSNARFITADLCKEFDFLKTLPKENKINKVLLDPPRTGAFEVLPHVVALKPERILYVSCNPATLARDAKYLTQHGYVLDQAGVMDMFPHTQHVESMALFIKKC